MAAFQFPSNPTQDQIVTGPAGQQFQWDGEKWVAIGGGGGGGGGGGAQILLVADEATAQTASEADPLNFYVWPGDGGGGDGSGVGVAGVSSFNGRTGAVTLTANDILTLVGTGNWLPVDSPAFTTILSGPALNVSQIYTNTVQSSAGLGGSISLKVQDILIGRGGSEIQISTTGVYASVSVNGAVTLGGDATSALQAVPLQQVQSLIAAAGGSGIPEPTTAGSFLRTNTGTWVAGLPLTAGQTNALTGPLQLASAAGGGFPATSLLFGTDTATPVSQIAQGAIAGGLYIGAGATRTNLGQWIARVVAPTGIRCETGAIDFFAHSGMTVGNSFIPSMQLQVSTSRVMVMNVGFGMPVLAAAPASVANGVMYYNSANHTLNVYVNNAWTALGAGAQIITVADEATAITQSAANPNNFYVWS